MTELEFARRLKQYRKAKNLTQQELADRLGVSNKSVSRWEGGSYPDVSTLGPLAKALGVTVDDLLGEAPPIRTMGRGDWQNLLSFAFAIGGGVLFFLLELFVPTALCYLLYLGAMAYGVYLQKHYTYHSRWFHTANLVMNFFVNGAVVSGLLALAGQVTAPDPVLFLPRLVEQYQQLQGSVDSRLAQQLVAFYLLYLLLSAIPTAVTGLLIRSYVSGGPLPLRLRPAAEPTPITPLKAIPALFPVLLGLYWLPFESAALPGWLYMNQRLFFHWGVAIFAMFSLLLLWKKERRHMLLPAGVMLACTLGYSGMLRWARVYSTLSRAVHPWRSGMNGHYYHSFGQITWGIAVWAVVLAALYLLCCRYRLRLLRGPSPSEEGEPQ